MTVRPAAHLCSRKGDGEAICRDFMADDYSALAATQICAAGATR
jgi:hypothetical protein